MILKAKHHWFIHPFFKWYAVWKTERHFKPVELIGEFTDRNLPIILLANHISWWDGFWAMYLNLKILRRKFHFMMLESQLRKYWFFNYTGGYSINKQSKSLVESLQYTAGLIERHENMVLVFPQGELESIHLQTFSFEKGIERILKNKQGKLQLVFMANLTDYFSKPKEGLYIYFTEYASDDFSLSGIESAYNRFYANCVVQQRTRRF